jgi:transglutaminase-like putative cysteine protease
MNGTTSADPVAGGGWAVIGRLVAVAALAGVAGWGFQRVFAPADLVPAVPVAAVVPALVAGLLRSRPLWLSLLANLLLWLVSTVTLVYGDVRPAVLPRVAGDLASSWHALLSTLLPAPGEPSLLVLVHSLVWLAGVAGAELVARTRSRGVPGLPAVAVFGVAVLLGVDGPGSNLPVAAALLALLAVLSLLADDRPPVWIAAGVPALAVLAGLALLVGPVLPLAREPYNPRTGADVPPPVRFESVSPLDRVSAWLQQPETDLFTVRADRPLNWRLAVLDRYDGVRWTTTARFQPTGGRVPTGDAAARGYAVDQTITLHGLRDRWLPAAERPAWISGADRVATDTESGTLVATRDPADGLTYQVSSHVGQPSPEELRAAVPAGEPALLAFPDGPQEAAFRTLAQRATEGATIPYQQADQLKDFMRSAAKYDISAPPGHSLPSLNYFLRDSRRGTSEQFAATYALLARTLGLPSRVVVGFRPGEAKDGAYHVRTGDVLAWAEVKFQDIGWLAFDPTPPRSGSRDRHDVVSAVEKDRQRVTEQLGKATENKPRPSTRPTSGQDRTRGAGAPTWALGAVAGAALVVAYPVLGTVLPWWRRRRRRTAGDAGGRVAGAWRQTCDDLGLAGETALTAEEVAVRGTSVHGREIASHLLPLADISNFADFAPDEVSHRDADEAWRHSDAVRRLVARRTPAVRRVRRRLHPRTLLGPRRPRKVRHPRHQ